MGILEHTICMDIGSSMTRIFLVNTGLVYNQPTQIAYDQKQKKVIATGYAAKAMIGKTKDDIKVINVVENGEIKSTYLLAIMLDYIFKYEISKKIMFSPKLIIALSNTISPVQKNAFAKAINSIGIKKIYFVSSQIASLNYLNIEKNSAVGNFLIDFGYGKIDICTIAKDKVIKARSIHFGIEQILKNIQKALKKTYGAIFTEKDCEHLLEKIGLGNVQKQYTLYGKNILTGINQQYEIDSTIVYTKVKESIDILIDEIIDLFEQTSMELLKDIMQNGIYLVGGGTFIQNIPFYLETSLGIKINTTDLLKDSLATQTVILGLTNLASNTQDLPYITNDDLM